MCDAVHCCMLCTQRSCTALKLAGQLSSKRQLWCFRSYREKLSVQELQAGCCRAQQKRIQPGTSSMAIQQPFIAQLAGYHAGFEAILLPLMGAPTSADLLFEQCQLALKAPKVGQMAGFSPQGLRQIVAISV